MKVMKFGWVSVTALGSLLALGSIVQGQENKEQPGAPAIKPPPPATVRPVAPGARPDLRAARIDMRVKSMAQSLALTDEQKEKVKPIIEEEIKKMEELSQDRTGAPEERMKKFRDLREATNAKIKPLLSAEQQEKLANLTQRSQRRIEPTNGKTNAAPAAPGSPTAPAKPAPPAK